MSREAMKSCIPRFNAMRMVNDYVEKFYGPARDQCQRMKGQQRVIATELARWKEKVHAHWPRVSIQRLDPPLNHVDYGEVLPIRIGVQLEGLAPEDVVVECLLGKEDVNGEFVIEERHHLQHAGQEGTQHEFALDLKPSECGLKIYKLRIYPYHKSLSHPFEMGYMLWV